MRAGDHRGRGGEASRCLRRLARVRARALSLVRMRMLVRARRDSSPRFFSFSWLVFLAAHVGVVALLGLYRRPTATLRIAHYYSEWGPPTANRCDLSPRSEIHKVHNEPFL